MTRYTSFSLTSTDVVVADRSSSILRGLTIVNTHASTKALVSVLDSAGASQLSLLVGPASMESIPDWALDAELEGITLSLISGPSSVIVSVAYDLDVETPDTPTDKLNTYKSEHLNVGRFSAQSARVRGKDA